LRRYRGGWRAWSAHCDGCQCSPPILESFPCFIVTSEAKRALSEMSVSGAAFDDVNVPCPTFLRSCTESSSIRLVESDGTKQGATTSECPRTVA
jgi:hypothetical protein